MIEAGFRFPGSNYIRHDARVLGSGSVEDLTMFSRANANIGYGTDCGIPKSLRNIELVTIENVQGPLIIVNA